MMALLLTLCSDTYAYYMNTLTIYATGPAGSDSTGWVNSTGTKVDNSMIVSNGATPQRSWAIFKPNNPLPVNAVIASVNLIFNVTNVSNPGAETNQITVNPSDMSTYAGLALYGGLQPAFSLTNTAWGTATGQISLSIAPANIVTYLNYPAITLGWIETSGSVTYTISGETSGTSLAPRLVINYYTPCPGTPTPGTASSTASVICPNTPFTLSDVGYTVDTGVTYQWQSSSNAAGPFSDIPTATNPASYTVSNQAATTYYRLKVVCAFNGSPAFSNVVTVTENPPTSCYCTPNPGSGGCTSGDGIGTFVMVGEGPGITDFGTGCHAGAYDDRYAESVTLMQCVSYTALVTKISNNGQQDNVNVWIDFNDDGFFQASEVVGSATNITDAYPSPDNITISIPTGATTGNHRMRVMVGRGVLPAAFDPCNAGPVWNYGETHDYMATIVPTIVLNTPIVAGLTDVCAGSCVLLTANVANANAGTKYIWTYPPALTPVITTDPTLNICNATQANAGLYSVRAFYGCDTTAVGSATITIHDQPQATPSSNSPVCSGTTLNLNGTPIPPFVITGWEWQGPVFYDQLGQSATRPGMLTTYQGTYSMIVTDAFGCKDTFTTNVTVIQTPSISLTPTSPTTCNPGNDGQIKITGLTNGSVYDVFWTGPLGPGQQLSMTAAAGAVTITGLVAGSYTVHVLTHDIPACQTTDVITNITNPGYNITSTSPTNPTTCTPGNDGKIQLCGLPANSTLWDIHYNYNATPQTIFGVTIPANGCYTITGLSAGTYDNIYGAHNGCNTNTVGPVILSNPSYSISNVTFTNPSNCVPGCNGSITLSGLPGNTSGWTGTYTKDANPVSFGPVSTNASGQIVLSNLCDGSYANFQLTRNGCQTNIWLGAVILSNPSYSLSGITTTNPSGCTNSTGSFKICGLPPSTGGFVVTYLNPQNNVVNTPTVSSDASGCITVSNLVAGTYDNIYATKGGCVTNAMGPITLTNPANPVATASSNSPVCSGNDIIFTGGSNGLTYSWYFPSGTAWTTVQSPTIVGSSLTDSGTYKIVVTDPATGCKDSATTHVVVNKTPNLTSISYVNPTKCVTCNGSFTISGLDPNTNYTLHYLKNAILQFPVNFTSTATGTYTRTGQCAGLYDNIYVTSAAPASCPSNALGPITLTDPPAPPQPSANSNSPVCAGDTLKLTANSATYNATYRWSGPAAFGINIAGQNQTIPNVTAAYGGTYSVTVKDTFNCTSLPTTISVSIKPQPVISIGSNTPVCVGVTLELYSSSDIPGSTVLWTYPDGPTSTLDSPTRPNAIPSYGGEYKVQYTSPFGCVSKDSTDVFIGNILLANLVASSNSPLCSGDTLKLNAGALVPGAQYSWTGPNGYNTPIANPIRTNIQVADSGDYIVSATLNGCLGAPDTVHVVVHQTDTATISISVFPGDTICVGDNVTFTATITNGGSDAQYQWVKNGIWVIGALDSFWGSPYLVNHDSIYCILTSNEVCVANPVITSNTIGITLGGLVAPSVILTASPNIILPGNPVVFTATVANAGPNPTFEWFKNGVLIAGATTNTYTTVNITNSDQIKVVVHSSWTCALTDTASAIWGNPNISTSTKNVNGQETVISLYPNPNDGNFTLNGIFGDVVNQKDIPVQVLNALGQVVYNDKVNIANNVLHMQFALVDMPAGMYMLRLGEGNNARMLRFTIK